MTDAGRGSALVVVASGAEPTIAGARRRFRVTPLAQDGRRAEEAVLPVEQPSGRSARHAAFPFEGLE